MFESDAQYQAQYAEAEVGGVSDDPDNQSLIKKVLTKEQKEIATNKNILTFINFSLGKSLKISP